MRYLGQFGIILGVTFAGEVLHALIPLPIPASIYGIVLLFLLLECKLLPLRAVKEAGQFLIDIMPILFVPAAVGLMESFGILQNSWLSYLVITVATTAIVMAVSGWVTQLLLCRKRKKEDTEDA